jgi:hypothetical protein
MKNSTPSRSSKPSKATGTQKQISMAARARTYRVNSISPLRKYRAVRMNNDSDINRFHAWDLSYYNEKTRSWHELRNYDTRLNLKEFAVASGKKVVEITYKDLFNHKFSKQ